MVDRMWIDGCGIVECFDSEEWVEHARYQHGKIYFQVLVNKKTKEIENGWCDEHSFDDVYGKELGLKREDFPEVTVEQMLSTLNINLP